MKKKTLNSVEDLVAAGLVPPEALEELGPVSRRYAVAVTPRLVETMTADSGDAGPSALAAEALRRQFIPDARELDRHPAESTDPIGDDRHSPLPGLVHRYPDRVLLKVTGVCAVYCRFCFRRESVGPGKAPALAGADLAAALDYIRHTPQIWEVIVTGGDPFVLPPKRIAALSTALAAIPHVKVRRWHTRLPVAAPERVSADLAAALVPDAGDGEGQAVYVAVHANHPCELTPAARAACDRLRAAGAILLSQTVLLRGVNDSVETLAALMRAFVEARIKPYYLHHGDLAPGTRHLRVPLAEGQALMDSLRARLSGLAMPLYVLDIPGGAGKVPAGAAYVTAGAGGGWRVRDGRGGEHAYFDCCTPSG